MDLIHQLWSQNLRCNFNWQIDDFGQRYQTDQFENFGWRQTLLPVILHETNLEFIWVVNMRLMKVRFVNGLQHGLKLDLKLAFTRRALPGGQRAKLPSIPVIFVPYVHTPSIDFQVQSTADFR
jgi:hypothetical protein